MSNCCSVGNNNRLFYEVEIFPNNLSYLINKRSCLILLHTYKH